MSKISIVGELWDFLKVRKKWWLLPIVFFKRSFQHFELN